MAPEALDVVDAGGAVGEPLGVVETPVLVADDVEPDAGPEVVGEGKALATRRCRVFLSEEGLGADAWTTMATTLPPR